MNRREALHTAIRMEMNMNRNIITFPFIAIGRQFLDAIVMISPVILMRIQQSTCVYGQLVKSDATYLTTST
jgi:hypothetical protein